jgi:hypothetical protein
MNYYTYIKRSLDTVLSYIPGAGSVQYIQEIALALLLVIAVGGGYWGYTFYKEQKEAVATEAFLEISDMFASAVHKANQVSPTDEAREQKIKDIWNDVLLLTDAAYNAHSSTTVAPFLLVYKAEIQIALGQSVDQVLPLVKQAVDGTSSWSPFYDMLRLKYAKMQCDASEKNIQESGIKIIKELASGEKSSVYVEAAYLLGQWYLLQNDIEHARASFAKVADLQDGLLQPSLAKDAQQKLEVLG